jgi:transposase
MQTTGRKKVCSFPEAEGIRVVVDNLKTHSPAAFYEAFSPQQARYNTKKLEFHYTPEYSSWLNMAEVKISILNE